MSDRRTMPVLPVEAYTSQEWFDREQELHLFPHLGLRRVRRGHQRAGDSTWRYRPG